MSPVTIETFSQSLASAHSLAPSEMHTTLSAWLSQLQPEGGALAAAMLGLYSREFSENHIPTSRWVAERREGRRGYLLYLLGGKSSQLSPKDPCTPVSKTLRLVRFCLNDVRLEVSYI